MNNTKFYPRNTTLRLLPVMTMAVLLIVGCSKSSTPEIASTSEPASEAIVDQAKPETTTDSAASVKDTATPVEEAVLTAQTAVDTGKPLEVQIFEVTNGNQATHEKIDVLLGMFANSNTEAQRKLAHALVQLVDDEEYPVIRKCLLDTELGHQVLSVFMTDTLKRKNSIKLPMLLELAQTKNHPLQNESRQLLEAFTQKNYGTNWAQWKEAVDAWLVNNPT